MIREIAVNVHTKALYGLRLIDSDGEIIIETKWETFQDGKWKTKAIPEGEEIIGLKCDKYMNSLSFIFYRPSH